MEANEGVYLSKRDQLRFQMISDYLAGKIHRSRVAEVLGISLRQVSRLVGKVRKDGIWGILHGNREMNPVNRVSKEYKKMVMDLVKERYFDFNVTHCREKLRAEHGISVSYMTLLRWCREQNLVKRRHHKRRSSIRRHRVRMPSEGLLLQMDGSHHRWNSTHEVWCLIGAIDDATSDMPYAEFFTAEDTINCLRVMQKIVELKGIPVAIYVDRAGWFGGMKRQHFCQFKRACEELGIRVIFASSPQAKGRIERAWNTMQDRLIPEMRIRNIRRIPSANSFLQEQFLPNYWNKENKVIPQNLESKYQEVPPHVDLKEVFCIKEHRVVKSDHTISYSSQIFLVESPIKFSLKGQQIEIRTYQDQTWKAFYAGREVVLIKREKLRKYGT